MTDIWYYADGDRPVGPLDLASIKDALFKRSDWRSVLVYRGGTADWQFAGDVQALAAPGGMVRPAPPRDVIAPPRRAPEPTVTPRATAPMIATRSTGRASAAPVVRPPGREMSVEAIMPSDEFIATFAPEKPRSKIWTMVIGAVSCVAVAIGGHLINTAIKRAGKHLSEDPNTVEDRRQAHRKLDQFVAGLRAELPKRIDPNTTLTAVAQHGHMLEYALTSHTDPRLILKTYLQDTKAAVMTSVCQDKRMMEHIGRGTMIRYSYVDRDNNPLGWFSVSREACP